MAAGSKPVSYSWFSGDTGRYLFQSSIDIFRNNYSGLLFIKPLETSHRILFITEMGIKIFDMEIFRNENLKVHYCLDAMNRKSVTNTLGKDLSLMIFNLSENDKLKMMKEKGTGKTVIRARDHNGTRYCYINDKTGKVEELISTGALTNKLNIKFYSESGLEPDSINLSHYNLKLNIHLVKLNEN